METKAMFGGATLSIVIKGHITGVAEVMELRGIVSSYSGLNTLELILEDAYVIPSSLIGYLVKLAKADNTRVVIKANSEELKSLITDLNLDKIFEMR